MRLAPLQVLFSGVLIACGGASPAPVVAPTPAAVAPAPTPEPARAETRQQGMGVSGLRGTLSPRQVSLALSPHMTAVTGCFAMRSQSFAHLGGQLRMAITVNGAGTVQSVHPEDSSVGDREVERCVRQVIREVQFPATQGGGQAEVRWALSVESSTGPSTWSPELIERLVARRGTRLLERCHASPGVQVTAYVSRRGRVLRTGAASVERHDDEVLDCIAEQVRRWRMPRPRRVTKVTFEIGA